MVLIFTVALSFLLQNSHFNRYLAVILDLSFLEASITILCTMQKCAVTQ